MQLPSIESYGNYSSDNYGAHSLRFDIGIMTVWFSYTTPVAFQSSGKLVVRQNDWGPTTGKHLNWIDSGDSQSKKERVAGSEFERLLSETVSAGSK